MTSELSNFASRLRKAISSEGRVTRVPDFKFRNQKADSHSSSLRNNVTFNQFAIELFALQFKHNAAYLKICKACGLTPEVVEHWTQIPAVPTAAFKVLELTCLPPNERTVVFLSSGTTEQRPSRHFHNTESLAVYETSLWSWFKRHVVPALGSEIPNFKMVVFTPPLAQVPHSSLVHMFEIVRQKIGRASVPTSPAEFLGKIAADGSWTLDFVTTIEVLSVSCRTPDARPLLLLGTAFSFVHLLDFLEEKDLRFDLPTGSRVMETGGYKNRSRSMPKAELRAFIMARLGVPAENILCEYSMSELSSQAYDSVTSDLWHVIRDIDASCHLFPVTRHFHFPPWVRVQIVSPETGREVADGETGLIRIFDLANVFSVMVIQTEDLGIRRGESFELLGRSEFSEPRGCSLMTLEERASSLP